jgi:hypothetical protein
MEKTLEQKMEQEFIPMIEKMIQEEKEHQDFLNKEIEILNETRHGNSKFGRFLNFIFPFHNESIDEMILVIHSFVKESERMQAHMEMRIREYKKFFLNQD